MRAGSAQHDPRDHAHQPDRRDHQRAHVERDQFLQAFLQFGVAQPGAAPTELISQVVRPIEDAIANVQGMRHISATASDGSASLTVEFELETDSDRALNDVKDAVASVRADLPQSITEPLVRRVDVTGMPILTYAVGDPTRSIEGLSKFVDDVIARELTTLRGIGQVSRIGGADLDAAINDFAWELGAKDDHHASARFRRQLVRHLGRAAIEQANS